MAILWNSSCDASSLPESNHNKRAWRQGAFKDQNNTLGYTLSMRLERWGRKVEIRVDFGLVAIKPFE
jgi:hypothetical protein